MSDEMDEDWFAPEVEPEPTPQHPPAPTKTPGHNAPACAPVPAAKTTDKKPVEEKPEEWFSKPSTKSGQEDPNEDWFEKLPKTKPEASPKKNLPQEVNPPPPKTAPPKDLPAQISAKEEDPDNWFAKVSENPTVSGVTLVKSQPRKESYMFGYISKVVLTECRMKTFL